jgi:exopolysaccharide production protein ExoZ
MRKLRSIQILRAVAAIGVVIYHATHSRFTVGAAGVDLFFVISGFIMATIAPGRAPLAFLADRAWRIYPLYFVCLAVALLTIPPAAASCPAVSLTLLPLGCWSYLTPAWTLTYEIAFYALMALALWRRELPVWLTIPTVALALAFAPPGPNLNPLLLIEFLGGYFIAKLPLNERAALPLIALALAIFCVPKPDLIDRALWWGVPSGLLVYGALSLERRFIGKVADLFVALGDASYSIYLTNYILHRIAPMWWPVEIYAFVSTGYLIHLWIERPLLKARGWRWHGLRTAV